MRRKLTSLSLLLTLGVATVATTPLAHALNNNGSANNLAGKTGKQIRYKITVPEGAGRLSIRLSGGTGDADLYVRVGSAPSRTRFDCRPYRTGNRETCSISNPKADTYYIMVHAYSTFSGVKLSASYVEPNATTPGQQPTTPEPPTQQPVAGNSCMNDVEQQLLEAHNTARAQGRRCGGTFYPAVPPLEWSCPLGDAAEGHSSDMANTNFFSHTGSDGSNPGQRISSAGYEWRAYGENIAAGQTSVASVMSGWIDSPGHCQNIMSSATTEMGAARVSAPGSDYSSYWTAVFARPQ